MNLKKRIIEISESKCFTNLTTIIIVIYSSILGLKTLINVESEYIFILYLLDYFITIYFLVEISIKLSAQKNIKNFFSDGWNLFDFIIVAIAIVPIENSTMIAVIRLFRIFKVLRLITIRPGLKRIIDALMAAIPSIIDIVILMFIIFYIYAIIGNFLFSTAPSGMWNDFLVAMLTLFGILTFEGWTDIMYEAMKIHPWSWIYFVSFIIIAGFVFFNLFIAVIIGEMEKLSREEDHQEEVKKLDLILEEIKKLNAKKSD